MAFSLSASAAMVRPAAAAAPMRAQRAAPAKVSAARVAAHRSVAGGKGRRALVVVANEKQGKGGEEGGAKFDRTAFGIVASNANYGVLGSAVVKVRARHPRAARGAWPHTSRLGGRIGRARAVLALRRARQTLTPRTARHVRRLASRTRCPRRAPSPSSRPTMTPSRR
jgi:hypothetical protein